MTFASGETIIATVDQTLDGGIIINEGGELIVNSGVTIQINGAVINSGKFTLVTNADYPTQFLNGNSSESMFEMIYNSADNPGSDHLGGMYKESGYGDYKHTWKDGYKKEKRATY